MSIEKVRAFFAREGREQDILEFPVSSATVELAAAALGCEGARIHEDGALLIVCAGDAKVDNAKFRHQFHTKAKMLTPEQVVEFTGHAIGGVCPFAVDRSRVKVYLDVSMKRFDIMYPAAGSSSSAVKLTIPELETCSGYEEWIDVCKGWQETP